MSRYHFNSPDVGNLGKGIPACTDENPRDFQRLCRNVNDVDCCKATELCVL